jgi:predicted ATPase
MLRETAEELELIAAETIFVLFLENLHRSDPSTLDLIATVARRIFTGGLGR